MVTGQLMYKATDRSTLDDKRGSVWLTKQKKTGDLFLSTYSVFHQADRGQALFKIGEQIIDLPLQCHYY